MIQTEPNRISLCMIVKDEEATLARCLSSAKPYVDEMVIVDTGSCDHTVDIARAAGAAVHFFPWTGDFSAARNVALDHATGDWILSLDADEELEQASGSHMRAIVELPVPGLRSYGIMVKNIHNREEIPLLYVSFAKRLFPRHPRIRWTRPIHEQITHLDGDHLLEYVLTDQIVITHYGYARDIWEGKDKGTRNLEMIQKAISDDPNDAFNYYNLGQEHYSARRYEEALVAFEKALDLSRSMSALPNFYAYVYALATGSCVEARRIDRGIEIGEEGATKFEYADLFVNLGSCHLLRGNFDRAVHFYTRARSLDGVRTLYSGDTGSTSWRPAQNLGDAYMLRGDPARALEFFHQSIAAKPDRPYPNLRAAMALLALGRTEDARRYAERVLAVLPDHEDAHLVLVDCLVGSADQIGARDRIRQLIEKYPLVARYRVRMADMLLGAGQAEEALPILRAVVGSEQWKGLVHQKLGISLNRLQRFHEAVEAFTVATTADPSDLRSRVGLEAARILSEGKL
jgi:tetratricopeptide (TPR) repeat protein